MTDRIIYKSPFISMFALCLISGWVLAFFGYRSYDIFRSFTWFVTTYFVVGMYLLLKLVDFKPYWFIAGMVSTNCVACFGVAAYLFNYPIWQYTAFTVIAGFAFSILSIAGFAGAFYLMEKLPIQETITP